MPWVMMVLSRATIGWPALRATDTSSEKIIGTVIYVRLRRGYFEQKKL
jgi:hypothetical protein